MTITIVGAGMAGLLAANILSRRHDIVLVEKQDALPHNHSALLRFRSSAVGDALGIPFRKVTMLKAVAPWRNPVADLMAYSRKVGGQYTSDRSLITGLVQEDRWIAPPDLIDQMSQFYNREVEVCLGTTHDFILHHNITRNKVISTIPMPSLMEQLDYQDRLHLTFIYRPGFNIRAKVTACDAYVTLVVPDPGVEFSKASITGDELIIEVPGDYDQNKCCVAAARMIDDACYMLGINSRMVKPFKVLPQEYLKIMPIDEDARKDFIHWASSQQQIAFSLGRYACWRPSLMLDDLIKDIKRIEGWINNTKSGYDMDMHRVNS